MKNILLLEGIYFYYLIFAQKIINNNYKYFFINIKNKN